MLRLLYFLSALTLASAACAEEKVLRWTEELPSDLGPVQVPLELYLDAPTDTQVSIKVAGNLGQIQRILPALLSDVVVNDCETRVGLEMQEALAEGDAVRVRGRVQIILYSCNKAKDFDSRLKLISNITTVDLLLNGFVERNCINAGIAELTINPSGLIGGALNLFGVTERLTKAVQEDINASLNENDTCIELPEPLLVIETELSSAGFRDFGEGTIGFVAKGSFESKSQNLIDLFVWLAEEGVLAGGGCECDEGG